GRLIGHVASMVVHPLYKDVLDRNGNNAASSPHDLIAVYVPGPMPEELYPVKYLMTERPKSVQQGCIVDPHDGKVSVENVRFAPYRDKYGDWGTIDIVKDMALPVGASSSPIFAQAKDGEPMLVMILSGASSKEAKKGMAVGPAAWVTENRVFLECMVRGGNW